MFTSPWGCATASELVTTSMVLSFQPRQPDRGSKISCILPEHSRQHCSQHFSLFNFLLGGITGISLQVLTVITSAALTDYSHRATLFCPFVLQWNHSCCLLCLLDSSITLPTVEPPWLYKAWGKHKVYNYDTCTWEKKILLVFRCIKTLNAFFPIILKTPNCAESCFWNIKPQ